MRPTDWNQAKAMQEIRGVRLEGNRPAARVTAVAQGKRVSGLVTDCDAHPVAGLAVQLGQRTSKLVADGLLCSNQRRRKVLTRSALHRIAPRARGDTNERARVRVR